jgi:hypothetical protein
MRTATVAFRGGDNAPGSKRMRAIWVAGRSRVNACCVPVARRWCPATAMLHDAMSELLDLFKPDLFKRVRP